MGVQGVSAITKVVGFRVANEIADELERLAQLQKIDKSDLFRQIFAVGYAVEIKKIREQAAAL